MLKGKPFLNHVAGELNCLKNLITTMRILRPILEIIGWLQIAASPIVAGLIIGSIIYSAKTDTIGLIIGIIIALTGLVVGVIWATKVWRREGTMNFMSRLLGTPELDKKQSE